MRMLLALIPRCLMILASCHRRFLRPQKHITTIAACAFFLGGRTSCMGGHLWRGPRGHTADDTLCLACEPCPPPLADCDRRVARKLARRPCISDFCGPPRPQRSSSASPAERLPPPPEPTEACPRPAGPTPRIGRSAACPRGGS